MLLSAQGEQNVPERVPEEGQPVRGAVDKAWLDELPIFCDTSIVAKIFGVSGATARRWMRGEHQILPSARRPDGRLATAREHVVALARKMYGEMGS